MSSVKWLPLTSDPDVMNKFLKKLGIPEKFGMSDLVSLDDEYLDAMSSTPLAIVLLFPLTKKYAEYRDKQEELLKKQEKLDDVYYMKQTASNICGTIALIHAIANNESTLNLKQDSVLKNFLDSTKDMSPEERGKCLEQAKDISAMLESIVPAGQSGSEESNHHFIAFVEVNGKLVELDGRKSGPILLGDTSKKSFVKDAADACKAYMKCDPDNLEFHALSLGPV